MNGTLDKASCKAFSPYNLRQSLGFMCIASDGILLGSSVVRLTLRCPLQGLRHQSPHFCSMQTVNHDVRGFASLAQDSCHLTSGWGAVQDMAKLMTWDDSVGVAALAGSQNTHSACIHKHSC